MAAKPSYPWIYAQVKNNSSPACFASTSFQVQVRPEPVLSLPGPYTICDGQPITINGPGGFSSYTWSDGSLGSAATFATAGNYSLTVTKNYGSQFGWDGTLNGRQLPADDYWFVINRPNEKEFKGHFSLLR